MNSIEERRTAYNCSAVIVCGDAQYQLASQFPSSFFSCSLWRTIVLLVPCSHCSNLRNTNWHRTIPHSFILLLFSQVLVDEFQDVNGPQYELLSLLGGIDPVDPAVEDSSDVDVGVGVGMGRGKSHERDESSAGRRTERRRRTHMQCPELFVVGDSDQAIYGWRGADWRNQGRFDSDFGVLPVTGDEDGGRGKVRGEPVNHTNGETAGERFTLELNYRTTQPILDAAMALVEAPERQGTPTRPRDSLRLVSVGSTSLPSPLPIVVSLRDQDAEARWVAEAIVRLRDVDDDDANHGDVDGGGGGGGGGCGRADGKGEVPSIAVLYRTNAQSLAIERELLRQGVPHELVRQKAFFDRREVQDAMAYLRLLEHDDDLAVERVINVPPRKVGKKSIAVLRDWAQQHDSTLLGACAAVVSGSGDIPAVRPNVRKAIHTFYSAVMETRALATGLGGDGEEGERLLLGFGGSEEGDMEQIGGGPRAWKSPSRRAENPGPVPELLREVLKKSGYEDWMRYEQADGDERWQNVRELANLATSLDAGSLLDFLDRVALIADQDMMMRGDDEDGGGGSSGGGGGSKSVSPVKLLSIHASKGLEFDCVFVVGVEDELLPHFHSINNTQSEVDDADQYTSDDTTPWDEVKEEERREQQRLKIDEERRLLFVAMTRAKRHLFLCHAAERLTWGRCRSCSPSRFLVDDIPESMYRTMRVGSGGGGGQRRRDANRWGGR